MGPNTALAFKRLNCHKTCTASTSQTIRISSWQI